MSRESENSYEDMVSTRSTWRDKLTDNHTFENWQLHKHQIRTMMNTSMPLHRVEVESNGRTVDSNVESSERFNNVTYDSRNSLSGRSDSSSKSGPRKERRVKKRVLYTLLGVIGFIGIAVPVIVVMLLRTSDGKAPEAKVGTVDLEVTIQNMQFSEALADPESEDYRNFTVQFCQEMETFYRRSSIGEKYDGCLVKELRQGSIIVIFKLVFISEYLPIHTAVRKVFTDNATPTNYGTISVTVGIYVIASSSIVVGQLTVIANDENPTPRIGHGHSCKVNSACRTYQAVCENDKCGCGSSRHYASLSDSCVLIPTTTTSTSTEPTTTSTSTSDTTSIKHTLANFTTVSVTSSTSLSIQSVTTTLSVSSSASTRSTSSSTFDSSTSKPPVPSTTSTSSTSSSTTASPTITSSVLTFSSTTASSTSTPPVSSMTSTSSTSFPTTDSPMQSPSVSTPSITTSPTLTPSVSTSSSTTTNPTPTPPVSSTISTSSTSSSTTSSPTLKPSVSSTTSTSSTSSSTSSSTKSKPFVSSTTSTSSTSTSTTSSTSSKPSASSTTSTSSTSSSTTSSTSLKPSASSTTSMSSTSSSTTSSTKSKPSVSSTTNMPSTASSTTTSLSPPLSVSSKTSTQFSSSSTTTSQTSTQTASSMASIPQNTSSTTASPTSIPSVSSTTSTQSTSSSTTASSTSTPSVSSTTITLSTSSPRTDSPTSTPSTSPSTNKPSTSPSTIARSTSTLSVSSTTNMPSTSSSTISSSTWTPSASSWTSKSSASSSSTDSPTFAQSVSSTTIKPFNSSYSTTSPTFSPSVSSTTSKHSNSSSSTASPTSTLLLSPSSSTPSISSSTTAISTSPSTSKPLTSPSTTASQTPTLSASSTTSTQSTSSSSVASRITSTSTPLTSTQSSSSPAMSTSSAVPTKSTPPSTNLTPQSSSTKLPTLEDIFFDKGLAYTVATGDILSLTCSFQNLLDVQQLKISRGENKDVIIILNRNGTLDEHLKHFTLSSSDWGDDSGSVTISANITCGDENLYICETDNNSGEAKISITARPRPEKPTLFLSYELIEGQYPWTDRLSECKANIGDPPGNLVVEILNGDVFQEYEIKYGSGYPQNMSLECGIEQTIQFFFSDLVGLNNTEIRCAVKPAEVFKDTEKLTSESQVIRTVDSSYCIGIDASMYVHPYDCHYFVDCKLFGSADFHFNRCNNPDFCPNPSLGICDIESCATLCNKDLRCNGNTEAEFNDHVTIRCELDNVEAITFETVAIIQDDTVLFNETWASGTASVQDGSIVLTYTAEEIVLSIAQIDCQHNALYTFLVNDLLSDTTTVAIKTNAMTPAISSTRFVAGQLATITCDGIIGNPPKSNQLFIEEWIMAGPYKTEDFEPQSTSSEVTEFNSSTCSYQKKVNLTIEIMEMMNGIIKFRCRTATDSVNLISEVVNVNVATQEIDIQPPESKVEVGVELSIECTVTGVSDLTYIRFIRGTESSQTVCQVTQDSLSNSVSGIVCSGEVSSTVGRIVMKFSSVQCDHEDIYVCECNPEASTQKQTSLSITRPALHPIFTSVPKTLVENKPLLDAERFTCEVDLGYPNSNMLIIQSNKDGVHETYDDVFGVGRSSLNENCSIFETVTVNYYTFDASWNNTQLRCAITDVNGTVTTYVSDEFTLLLLPGTFCNGPVGYYLHPYDIHLYVWCTGTGLFVYTCYERCPAINDESVHCDVCDTS